jgi:hypothetical protein
MFELKCKQYNMNQWMLWGSHPQHALPLLHGKRQPGNSANQTTAQRKPGSSGKR